MTNNFKKFIILNIIWIFKPASLTIISHSYSEYFSVLLKIFEIHHHMFHNILLCLDDLILLIYEFRLLNFWNFFLINCPLILSSLHKSWMDLLSNMLSLLFLKIHLRFYHKNHIYHICSLCLFDILNYMLNEVFLFCLLDLFVVLLYYSLSTEHIPI